MTGPVRRRGEECWSRRKISPSSPFLWPRCASRSVSYFGDDLHEGDVIFHNDVFSLGNQLNDVAVYKPIFHRETTRGVVGGERDTRRTSEEQFKVATTPLPPRCWQEGLRIPPVKVVEKGKLRQDVWDLIFANIRLDIVREDMKAEMGACVVGGREG